MFFFKHLIAVLIDTIFFGMVIFIHLKLPSYNYDMFDLYNINFAGNISFLFLLIYFGMFSFLKFNNSTPGEFILKIPSTFKTKFNNNKYKFITIIELSFYNIINYFLKIYGIKIFIYIINIMKKSKKETKEIHKKRK